jgi:hypothetical protein
MLRVDAVHRGCQDIFSKTDAAVFFMNYDLLICKESLSIDYYRRTYAFSVNERGIASKNATSYTKMQSLKRDLYRDHVHKESSHDFKSDATSTIHCLYIQKGPKNEYVTVGILD